MARSILLMAAITGALAVMLGAFGAHGLKNRLSPELMVIYQTGIQYHFYHALALLACGVLAHQGMESGAMCISAYLFVTGIVVFSGSLYVLAITDIRWLGAITPIGGVAFIAGWLALAIAVMQSNAQ
jgi:uncharacterized membrane protein YgdD (TMEM256/DUF423 family)